jgi:hypothetical protein
MRYPAEKTYPHPIDYTIGQDIDWTLIPEYMIGGLRRYIEDGIQPGDFLRAVFRNDLTGAVERADNINITILPNYVKFLYNYAPHDCWGSAERYEAWLEKGGLNGKENPNDEDNSASGI